MSTQAPAAPEAAIWQDVEFGAYVADLALWEELAARSEGPVIELGSGSGRVALRLASEDRTVLAIEKDEELAAELGRRAQASGAPVLISALDAAAPEGPGTEALGGDGPRPGLAIAPLHVIQQIAPEARRAALAGLARALRPGGVLAAVVVDESSLLHGAGLDAGPRPPDMRDVEGWVYSSEPLWVQVSEDRITVRRLRRRVSPGGEIERSVHDEVLHRLGPSELEEEARAAGLSPAGRRTIESGPGEADSIAILLEVPDGG
ncbi:MAG: class I SAM-dependent methyltransferase [Solirubrobacterales bacterium]